MSEKLKFIIESLILIVMFGVLSGLMFKGLEYIISEVNSIVNRIY